MKLFTLDENQQVDLNKEWIHLVPEFSTLLKRDRGSKGDSDGRKKLKARQEFTYIYFMWDFSSPLRDWEEHERHEEALRYAGLTEANMDKDLVTASNHYNMLLMKSARSLRTLRAVQKSLDSLDTHFEQIDFTKTDKKGELLHNPNSYLANLQKLDAAYTAVEKFEKRVMDELSGVSNKIRGTATLGKKETTGMGEWKEEAQPVSSASVSFKELGSLLAAVKEGEEE